MLERVRCIIREGGGGGADLRGGNEEWGRGDDARQPIRELHMNRKRPRE